MLHTHEVTGSSPVVSTRNEKHHPKGWCFSFLPEQGTRTHLNARCQWHLAATSSQTGGNHTLCPLAKRLSSPVVPPEASTQRVVFFISGAARDSNPSKCKMPVVELHARFPAHELKAGQIFQIAGILDGGDHPAQQGGGHGPVSLGWRKRPAVWAC